jgi:hypothetical protein
MYKRMMQLAIATALAGCPDEHAPAPRRDPAERPRTDASTPTPPHLDDDAALRDPFEPLPDASQR